MDDLLDDYNNGYLTNDELQIAAVHTLTRDNIEAVIAAFPSPLIEDFKNWLSSDEFGDSPTISSAGSRRIPQQAIEAAQAWRKDQQ